MLNKAQPKEARWENGKTIIIFLTRGAKSSYTFDGSGLKDCVSLGNCSCPPDGHDLTAEQVFVERFIEENTGVRVSKPVHLNNLQLTNDEWNVLLEHLEEGQDDVLIVEGDEEEEKKWELIGAIIEKMAKG